VTELPTGTVTFLFTDVEELVTGYPARIGCRRE
jgi:hypothetical protein